MYYFTKEMILMSKAKAELLKELEQQQKAAEAKVAEAKAKAETYDGYQREARRELIRPIVVLILMAVSMVAFSKVFRMSEVWNWFSSIATDDPAEWSEAFVTQVGYTFYGFTYLILAPIGAGWLGFLLTVVGLGATIVMETAWILPAGWLAVVIRLLTKLSGPGYYKKQAKGMRAEMENHQAEVQSILAKIADTKAYIQKAADLYQRGIQEKCDDWIAQAAEMENQDAIAYMDKKKGAELYEQAMTGEEPDLELLEAAADLNHPAACKAYGEHLMKDANSGMYTADEKEGILRDAVDYLWVAAEDGDLEAEFMRISCRIQYESNTLTGWREMLARVRAIKKSGKLPEMWDETCEEIMKALVEIIDRMAAKEASKPKPKEPKVKRCYCAYENCGVCTYYSTGSYLGHCDYLNDPGQCSAALLNKALRFEFY